MTATARVTSPGRARQRKAADYVALLEAVKVEIGGSRVRAARVIERLAADLGATFLTVRGVRRRNLHYMRAFAEAWPEKVPQPVAKLPWGHGRVLLDRLEDSLNRAQATEVSMASRRPRRGSAHTCGGLLRARRRPQAAGPAAHRAPVR